MVNVLFSTSINGKDIPKSRQPNLNTASFITVIEEGKKDIAKVFLKAGVDARKIKNFDLAKIINDLLRNYSIAGFEILALPEFNIIKQMRLDDVSIPKYHWEDMKYIIVDVLNFLKSENLDSLQELFEKAKQAIEDLFAKRGEAYTKNSEMDVEILQMIASIHHNYLLLKYLKQGSLEKYQLVDMINAIGRLKHDNSYIERRKYQNIQDTDDDRADLGYLLNSHGLVNNFVSKDEFFMTDRALREMADVINFVLVYQYAAKQKEKGTTNLKWAEMEKIVSNQNDYYIKVKKIDRSVAINSMKKMMKEYEDFAYLDIPDNGPFA
jgi:hypothetical protein